MWETDVVSGLVLEGMGAGVCQEHFWLSLCNDLMD